MKIINIHNDIKPVMIINGPNELYNLVFWLYNIDNPPRPVYYKLSNLEQFNNLISDTIDPHLDPNGLRFQPQPYPL